MTPRSCCGAPRRQRRIRKDESAKPYLEALGTTMAALVGLDSLRMAAMKTWPEAREIDWSELPGAYGTDRDVVAALETLRAGPSRGDDFADALNDFLWGHVTHQGTIYPITPRVLPFLFDVIEALSANEDKDGEDGEIAEFILCCAAFARQAAAEGDASERAVGAELLEVLAQHHERLRWLAGISTCAIATMLCVPALAAGVLSGEEHEPREVLAVVLSKMGLVSFEPSILAWAAPRLLAIDHPVAQAAARILKSGAIDSTDGGRLAALGEALDYNDEPMRKHSLDELRERFGIRVPSPSLERPGESQGIVAIVEDGWFAVHVDKQSVTVRWPRHPFAENDLVVLVEVNKRNIPREVRGTDDKAEHRATFDERGRMVGAPSPPSS